MFDTHIHTEFSTDSDEKIEEIILEARNKDIGIIITDHMDLKYPKDGEFTFDIDKYFDAYGKLRSEKVLIGIEIGMRLDCLEQCRALKDKYSFDNIIGSIHVIDDYDLYWENFYMGKSKIEVYSNYFNTMFECVKAYDFINVLGHMDYITRYARFDDKRIYLSEFGDIIDEILKIIIQREIALEINIKSISNKLQTNNMKSICKRYAELKGKYITIGSDAHVKENIGKDFILGQQIADSNDLKIVYFKEGKMQYQRVPTND